MTRTAREELSRILVDRVANDATFEWALPQIQTLLNEDPKLVETRSIHGDISRSMRLVTAKVPSNCLSSFMTSILLDCTNEEDTTLHLYAMHACWTGIVWITFFLLFFNISSQRPQN